MENVAINLSLRYSVSELMTQQEQDINDLTFEANTNLPGEHT
jgi:hypothetical protein